MMTRGYMTRRSICLLSWIALLSMLGISKGSVLCPGQPAENYCDCSGDCAGFPEWCGCREAKECCKGAQSVVLCPGQPRENYCDCDGDCTDRPEWCGCKNALKCCSENGQNFDLQATASATTTVLTNQEFSPIDEKNILCPGQPPENYCDCDGDCTSSPETWCGCEEAQNCCRGVNLHHDDDWHPSNATTNWVICTTGMLRFPNRNAIVGGSIAGAAMLLAAVVVVWLRRNRREDKIPEVSKEAKPDDDTSVGSTVFSVEEVSK